MASGGGGTAYPFGGPEFTLGLTMTEGYG